MTALERLNQTFEGAIQLAIRDAQNAVAGHHDLLGKETGLKPPDPTDAEIRAGDHIERALRGFFERVTEVKGMYAQELARPDAKREKLIEDLSGVLKEFRKAFEMEFENSDISDKVRERLKRFI